jgi:hypothetical protein
MIARFDLRFKQPRDPLAVAGPLGDRLPWPQPRE